MAGQDGTTALHWAAASCNSEICRRLIESGALLNAKDKMWRTPLDLANDTTKCIELYRDSLKMSSTSKDSRECQILLVVDKAE